ncbi:MAG: hypothetical protein AAF756_16890 [Pseudomonadota bacterium]
MASYQQQMQENFHRYEQEHGDKPSNLQDVAGWMIRNNLWSMKPADQIKRCASDLADALRNEYKTDRKGRRYRVNHAVRGEQGTFWADLDKAPRRHMEKAFQQRRQQIVGDCVQLSTDVNVYNDKNEEQTPINLVLDFTDDVEEHNLAREESAA